MRHVRPPRSVNLQIKNGVATMETQLDIAERARSQNWPGVSVTWYPDMGRGLVATTRFAVGDVVCDYHGLVVFQSLRTYLAAQPDRTTEYLFQINGQHKRLIDAASEHCPVSDHHDIMCLGRLANCARGDEANVKPIDISLEEAGQPRTLVLVARREIFPMQQIRFDYQDPVAHQLFN